MQIVSMKYPILGRQFDPYLKGFVVGFNPETGANLLRAIDPLDAAWVEKTSKTEIVDTAYPLRLAADVL